MPSRAMLTVTLRIGFRFGLLGRAMWWAYLCWLEVLCQLGVLDEATGLRLAKAATLAIIRVRMVRS